MGVMLSVLVAGVGAMDLIYCLAFVSSGEQPAIEDVPDKEEQLLLEQQQQQQHATKAEAELEQYKDTVRQQIQAAPRSTVEGVTYAQDGVPYKDGYRLEPSVGAAAQLEVLIEKLRILERASQEKEQQLEQMSVQMSELERNTAEQSLIIQELRSRSTSRAHSVERSGSYRANLSPADATNLPQIVLNDPHDSGGGAADEPRPSSSKFRPIRRDDGLRRSVKRRSVASITSQEDRTDELERLSQLEDEECARMDDYIPIVYSRDEQDPMSRRHNISPIPESCHHHEDEGEPRQQWVPERSPEPTLAANITRPWGDIKLDEMKEKAVLRPARSMSIEEEDIEPPVVSGALHVSESAPSNLSSHSNSPERGAAGGVGEPTLRRTTKEADLRSLLQHGGTSESQASSSSRPWTTEIIVQDEEEEEAVEDDDYDSDGGGRTARPVPQFMQSKSPSPYADGQAGFVGHERLPLADISNRLVPLVPGAPPRPPSRPRSPTPYDEPGGSSRESTPSSSSSNSNSNSFTLPASLEKVPNGFVSRDSTSISPHPAADVSSPSPSPHAGDFRPGSSNRMLSPLVTLEMVDAGTEGDTEGESEQLLVVPRGGRGGGLSPERSKSSIGSTRRKYKERKRVARSLTPIDYDQTFMDNFTDQHLSVTPAELEDYINSMDAIDFEPPPLIKPAYIYPTALPSLVLTDELGTDAQFHDQLSSKSFYGQSDPHEGVTLNHRVSYVEWIRKFPDNQTSHLALEDFDSDDEEVENIIGRAEEGKSRSSPLFPTEVLSQSAGNSPQPSKPETPVRTPHTTHTERTEFPVNVAPAYVTPSPVSLVSDLSDLSSQSSQPASPSLASQPSQTVSSSSLAIGSPLLNSYHNHSAASEHHFTPIPSEHEDDSHASTSSQLSSLQSPRPSPHTATTNTPLRPSLTVPVVPSRTPSVSPLPLDISPEELVFEIGHLDGLIFEAKSREPTPSRAPSRNESAAPLLSPDELAFDIGNMGGLILGPPSRSVSPMPPTPHPSIDSSASSLSPIPWEPTTAAAATSPVAHNDTRNSNE